MVPEQQEILPPLPRGNWVTRVTASVRLGRGVVGNTTFGFWAACLLALGLGVTFIVKGYPGYALAALAMCWALYLSYQGVTWLGVSKNADAGATGDEDYATVVRHRISAAKDLPEIPQMTPIESPRLERVPPVLMPQQARADDE